MTAAEMTIVQRDALRWAAFKQAANTLKHAAEEFAVLADNPDPVAVADARAIARLLRDELAAIDALRLG